MAKTKILESPWTESVDELLSQLDIDEQTGLDTQRVKDHKNKFAPNKLKESKRRSAWRILIDQFNSLIVMVLLAAVVVSFAFDQTIEAVAILIVVAVNGIIGFFTELKAVQSMQALKELTKIQATVVRDGNTIKIAAEELVPGDVVIIESGDLVSADIRLTEANKIQADESPLTGESVPVSKHTESVRQETPLAERKNMLYKGTSVTKGSGRGVVVATGMGTELGQITSLVEEAEEEVTPLEKRLDQLGRKLIWLTVGLALAVGAIGFIRGKELILMIETAVALAIAAIPEGLPIVATVALARGLIIMAKKNTLINRLASVETLGATRTICVDKTGTLTENRMQVTKVVMPTGTIEVQKDDDQNNFIKNDSKINPHEYDWVEEALTIGVLCNNAKLPGSEEEIVGDPLEVALLEVGAKANIYRHKLLQKLPEEREEAFDTATKMMATFNRINGEYKVAVKGSPEEVIDSCETIRSDGDAKPFDEDAKHQWKKTNDDLAKDGLRVIALATKKTKSTQDEPYTGLVFVGLVGLHDPPRQGVQQAIDECKKAGIDVVMITGDQPLTAKKIASSVNLDENISVMLGDHLKPVSELSDEELSDISQNHVFARVTPKQKLDLIEIFQHRGDVVAMTGDGVNDAPALKKADIGIAMGQRGTQVAKETADMILKDDSLTSIVAAVEQGRTIFKNIRKFVLYLLSGNMGEILAVAIGFLALAALPLYPLQILFLNFGIDVFPALAVGMGPGGISEMRQKPRRAKEPILNKKGWLFIWLFGIVIALAILASFTFSQSVLGKSTKEAVTIAFLTLGFSRLWHVLNMRDDDSTFLNNEIWKNQFYWIALLICLALLFSAIYIPALASILRTHYPGLEGWLTIIAASLIPVIVGHILKGIGVKILR